MSQFETRSISAIAGAAIVAVGLLLTVACTEADVIRSESGNIVLTTAPFTGTTVFDSGEAVINSLSVRPTDPDDAAGSGDIPFELILRSRASNILQETTVQGATLAAGRYRIDTMRFVLPTLLNDDPSTDPNLPCVDRVPILPGPAPRAAFQLEAFYDLDFSDDPTPPTFTVLDGATTTVTIDFDWDTLLPEYISRSVCRETGTCRAGQDQFPAPCISGFIDDDGYVQMLKDALVIR